MSKRVIVIASGRTERNALPHLLTHLGERDIDLVDVRIPAHNRDLTPHVANGVLRAAWFEMSNRRKPPDKFVVLIDADGQSIDDALAAYADFTARTADIGASVLVSVAKWHLEAWFFADEQGLRSFVGGSLGHVDPSAPDDIQNPKHHLKQLLPDPYTAQTAGSIAQRLSVDIVRTRSPSFAQFESAVLNGGPIP